MMNPTENHALRTRAMATARRFAWNEVIRPAHGGRGPPFARELQT